MGGEREVIAWSISSLNAARRVGRRKISTTVQIPAKLSQLKSGIHLLRKCLPYGAFPSKAHNSASIKLAQSRSSHPSFAAASSSVE